MKIRTTTAARLLAGLLLSVSAVSMMPGQTRTIRPTFDVASIKPNGSGANGSSINRSGGRITLDNVSMRECVAFAFSIPTGRDYELVGPAWLDTEKFDIAATFPPETSRERVREMVQELLAERFGLKTHRESKKLKAYALTVGKKGPILNKSAERDDGAFIYHEGHVDVRAFSIASFADRLSGPVFKLDRPVVDMTGIKGTFDFSLDWARDTDLRPGASIFTALQEQLGLKLEARQVTVKILIVDHVDRVASAN